MSSDFLTLINRLSTAVLLVVLLFACQKMPESRNIEAIPFDNHANYSDSN